ncbi:MAG: hypothetical protein RSE10_07105 [Oscillospiraceae bacterium]
MRNAITLQKSHGRSRATAPTEWGEYGKIALSHGDCEMQLHCKNLSGGAEPPPLRSAWSAVKMQLHCQKAKHHESKCFHGVSFL